MASEPRPDAPLPLRERAEAAEARVAQLEVALREAESVLAEFRFYDPEPDNGYAWGIVYRSDAALVEGDGRVTVAHDAVCAALKGPSA